MNRAMRRAAARAKPTEYQRVPLPRYLDEHAIFDDIERLLQKIEHGEIEHASGRPIMMIGTGEWTEVIPAMNGWISAWKAFDAKFNLGHDLSPMVRLCNCLNYATPISQHQLAAAKKCLAEQRRLFRTLPRSEVASVARTEQIRMMMDNVNEKGLAA